MRITILAYGTRGDVQPYLALGLGLERAGHAVRPVEAIRQMVSGRAMQDRAAALGERIRAEDGVGKAVEIISGYLQE